MNSEQQTIAKYRPILFSGPMVQALLAGTKTQTRRIIKPQPDTSDGRPLEVWYGWPSLARSGTDYHNITPPYGKPGDVLWVRETWWSGYPIDDSGKYAEELAYWYRADAPSDARPGDVSDEWCINEFGAENREMWPRWKPSIHMPFAACRLFLQVKSVRVERLQDISEDDAIAEGIEQKSFPVSDGGDCVDYENVYRLYHAANEWDESAVVSYSTLWEKINGPDSWTANPWVWVVEFERIEIQVPDKLPQP